MKWQLALALSFLAATAAPAQQAAPSADALAELDGYALGLATGNEFSGVVLVGQGDDIVSLKAYGRRDAQKPGAVTPDTRFNLASAGKMFTSVAILQQIAAGKLKLDTRVGKVLRDYPDKQIAKVTIRQLLTHMGGTGGIDLFGAENAANRARYKTVADMVSLHAARAPTFKPGSKQEYDNFGYVLLGRIVEQVSGEDYEAYVRRHIFEPTGMTRTGFVDCTATQPDLAVGYAEVAGKKVVNCATQPNRGFPAGGQVSTATDMFRLVRALQAGKLVPPKLFAEATKVQHQFMGLGFFATDYGKDKSPRDFRWGHGGSSDGASTDIRHYPATGETVIVLSNTSPPVPFTVANFLHAQYRAP